MSYSVNISKQRYQDTLLEKGWKLIGSGCYSNVYWHPDSKNVIKVSNEMDGWLDYAILCMNGPLKGNPHCPKIKRLRKFNFTDKTEGWQQHFYVAVIERLEGHSDKSRDDFMQARDQLYYRNGKLKSPSLARLINTLQENFARFDFHDQNAMRREKDGRMVITDPVVVNSHSSYENNRIMAVKSTRKEGVKILMTA